MSLLEISKVYDLVGQLSYYYFKLTRVT